MGTKTNPGKYDCYAKAEPDEPMFVLLARDESAPEIVRAWADQRKFDSASDPKIAEAYACADAMEKWRRIKRG